MKTKSRPKFRYQRRNLKQVQERAERSGGMFDRIFKSNYQEFKPKEGDNRIRFLPAVWENAEHYGVEFFMHRNVGPDNQSYLCRSKMLNKRCPVCEEFIRAKDEGEEEYAKAIRVQQRVAFWLINRKEKGGPLLYSMSWSADKDIAKISIDKDTSELLPIDHPTKGYDVLFTREGTGMKTSYDGWQVARRTSPLSDDEEQADEWLQYVTDHPLPDVFNFYSAEHIDKQFSAKGKEEEDEDDEEESSDRKKGSMKKKGTKKAKPEEDEDEIEEEEEETEEEEEEEEEAPKKKSKVKKKAKASEEDDEDEDLDDDEEEEDSDDEDEDEEPAPKTKKKVKAKKKAPVEDEDEEEEDSDEEDDEDEEPAPKKAKKKAKKVVEDDDDDEDEDEEDSEDEDEEEEPAPKKAKKKAPVEDEDEEEEEDEDEEEEEEEEEAPAKKKGLKKRSS